MINISKDIRFWIAKYLEGDGAVMILKWGDVIVSYCQLRTCIDLISVIDNRQTGGQADIMADILKGRYVHSQIQIDSETGR